MEPSSENLNLSPNVYVTAPSSPNGSSPIECYYSAPTSPRRKISIPSKRSDDQNSDFCDDFEFETSKKFNYLDFKFIEKFDELGYNQHDPVQQKYRERGGDSLPSMAFADELFFNGHVMPLKLPPRLQYDSDVHSVSQRSFTSTPRSPRTTCRIPFSRRHARDEDFDPFMVALEKVTEENRQSGHRRSKSFTLFMFSKSKCSTPRDGKIEGSPMSSPMQVSNLSTPNYSMPREFKGSAYARYVRVQNEANKVGLSPKGLKSPMGFFFGKKVRPDPMEREGPNKPISTIGENGENVGENKVPRVRGLLRKIASFGREKSKSKKTKQTSETLTTPRQCKQSSFRDNGQSSFRDNGNGRVVGNETVSDDAKMRVAEYKVQMKPALGHCLGYGVGSPRKIN